MERYHLLVIGVGPAGIATAVEAKVVGLNGVAVLGKTNHICDTIVCLYHPSKRVNVFSKCKRADRARLIYF